MTQYYMPAEWERHEATWLAWPHEQDDWPGKFECVPWVYLEIIRHLHVSESVRILVNDVASAKGVLDKQKLDHAQIHLLEVKTDRVWTRDYGPTFVHDESGNVIALDWQFNGWAKYDNWQNDNQVSTQLAERFDWQIEQPTWNDQRIVLEGGSIDVNGNGRLLTTEECLLSPIQSRNPEFNHDDYEQIFAKFLGIDEVIWLGQGIVGDDTHGHVDDLTRFVSENTVVTVVEVNRDDPNYEPLQTNLARLEAVDGLEVITLPMPEPVYFDNQRLPASYANFYIANEVVLVPTFNAPQDRQALGILSELFPKRKVVGIHAVDLVWGLGTLHCMTQQQPMIRA